MRKNIWLLMLVFALMGSLFACASVAEPAETEPTVAVTSASVPTVTTPATLPPDDTLAEPETVFSAELYSNDEIAVWVTPRDHMLVCVNLQNGAERRLCDKAVHSEFFVLGNRVIFREQDSGRICAVNTDGSNFISYYQMPLSSGVMKNGVLYFIDTEAGFSTETVLYKYEPLVGVWSTSILPGCYQSPVYDRVVFGESALYYIADDENGERIVRQSLENGERSVIYFSGNQQDGAMRSLQYAHGTLYFSDAGTGTVFAYDEANNIVSPLPISGDYICAVFAQGLVTRKPAAAGGQLVFHNFAGQNKEFDGGVIEATGTARALVRRTADDGRDLLALVKYPEDEVHREFFCELLDVITDRAGHAVVFCYGESNCRYLDLNQGTIKEFASETRYLNRVDLKRYVALDSIEHTVLSGQDMVKAEPALIARAFVKALENGDRRSLAVLLYDCEIPESFPEICFRKCELVPASSTNPDEKYVCRITYTPYTDGDLSILNYVPEILSSGRLTLVSDGVCWMITRSDVRNARSR